jgi:2'-5' RNA ligase
VAALDRAFVAVFPPPAVVAALDASLAPLRGRALRWVRPQQWHVTLRFLGRVPDVDVLVASLARAAGGVPAIPGVHLAGAGAFPDARRGSVLWIGVAPGGSEALVALAAAVEAACVEAGFAPEARPFHPHLTVARATRPRDLRALVAALETVLDAAVGAGPGTPWPVGEVALVSSDTRPDGARYEVVAHLPLAAP